MPTTVVSLQPLMTREQRKMELQQKVDVLKKEREERKARKARYDKYRQEKGKTRSAAIGVCQQ